MGLKKIVVNVGFKLLGKGLVSCSKIEDAVKEELKFYKEAPITSASIYSNYAAYLKIVLLISGLILIIFNLSSYSLISLVYTRVEI